MTANLVEAANTEVSTVHSAVGEARRAADTSLKDCQKLESAAKATLAAVTTWSAKVAGVALPQPASPAEVTTGLTDVSLTTTFGDGFLEGWVTQAEGARNALAGAHEAAEKLRSWAEPAGKAYNAAVLQLRSLREWLDWLYTNVGQVLGGVEHLGEVDATVAAEHLGDVAGWLEKQAARANRHHAAFEKQYSDLGAATRNVPGSYSGLVLASKTVPDAVQPAATKIMQVAIQLGHQARS